MKNIKLCHTLSFYMHKKVFSQFKKKQILGLSKATGDFEYLVAIDNFSILSIF